MLNGGFFTFSSRVCVKEIHVEEQLGIVSDESLETMLWSEVVSRLVQCQKAGTSSRVHVVSKALSNIMTVDF